MKKAHLSKWRQESTCDETDNSGSSEDLEFSTVSVDSSLVEKVKIARQSSEISSSTDAELEYLGIREKFSLTSEQDNDCEHALDLRTNVKKKQKKTYSRRASDSQALDLRICNVVSLKDITPVPPCVPDCDSLINPEEAPPEVVTDVPALIESANNHNVDIDIQSQMIPMDIIEKFNLIRNLKIAPNGAIIPNNIDDPGGMKLEVANEEIVETTPDNPTDQCQPDNGQQHMNGIQFNIHSVKQGA